MKKTCILYWFCVFSNSGRKKRKVLRRRIEVASMTPKAPRGWELHEFSNPSTLYLPWSAALAIRPLQYQWLFQPSDPKQRRCMYADVWNPSGDLIPCNSHNNLLGDLQSSKRNSYRTTVFSKNPRRLLRWFSPWPVRVGVSIRVTGGRKCFFMSWGLKLRSFVGILVCF